jgi:uncharacterized protein (TIGR02270 family)
MSPAAVVPQVVSQHAEEAAFLFAQRSSAVRAPHFRLPHVARLDERLSAHLEGLAVAGDAGLVACDGLLAKTTAETVFVCAATALTARDAPRFERLIALAAALPEGRAGIAAALGWVPPERLHGFGAALLVAEEPLRRTLGLAACGMHRVDPGAPLATALRSPDAQVRARALRTAGEIGKAEFLSIAAALIRDENPEVHFWAAWAAVLLGDRMAAVDALSALATAPGPHRERALQLVLRVMPLSESQLLLRRLTGDPATLRALIRGLGIAGDAARLPWLIEQTARDPLARVAGEAISMITGLDLALLDFDRNAPPDVASGPNDDPANPDVAMDEDDGLPWPDPEKLARWWQANAANYAEGERRFCGGPPTPEHCRTMLGAGYQRQRIGAALYLATFENAAPLFEWRAPAARQRAALRACGAP